MTIAMARLWFHIPCHLIFSLICILLIAHIGAEEANRKLYIVCMGDRPKDHIFASSLHTSVLNEVGSDASRYLLHSYSKSFNGFLAKLTEEEKQKIAEMEGVASVFASEKHELHTTRSWDFLGFPLNVKRSTVESDVIVGVIDTGIWPESESFSDEGFGPPPKKWKGICQGNFSCNNKIIGARYHRLDKFYSQGDLQSPRDSDGHGTHTASIAAGNRAKMASLNGLGLGTARGGVPSARIAVYKACWLDGCADHDILAAFEAAVSDGVDIISISIGGGARDYFSDGASLGAFYAMKNGILTSSSAGNRGPRPKSVGNVAPWSLTVAASATDRKFVTMVKLGNNMVYTGISVNAFKLDKMYPLIYGGDAPNTSAGYDGSISRFCFPGDSLDKNLVKGKIVVCDEITDGEGELLAGAVGSVIQVQGDLDFGLSFPLPAAVISSSQNQGSRISAYITSTRNATAIIMESTATKDVLAPYVASFSSRGPNLISENILKPDLTAPGVTILAAWSPLGTVSYAEEDKRSVSYNIISGTSMACPHATGVAAYIKSFHPTWSPAAIKSALMTTVSPMSAKLNTDAEFAYGAGHINPIKASDPGLVYDANEVDYVKFLCEEGYSEKILKAMTMNNSTNCSEFGLQSKSDLNYPSFALSTSRNMPINQTFIRTVTNVGSPSSIYRAIVTPPLGSSIQVQVYPKTLKFTSLEQKLSFQLSIVGVIDSEVNPILSASLVWDDSVHQVRSPIVVFALP